MNALERRKFTFLSKIALKYRLSLNNLCRIMHIDVNEKNKLELYQNLLIANPYEEDALRFLLCSECVGEYNKKVDGNLTIEEKIDKGLEEKLESDLKRAKVSRMLDEYNNLQKSILIDIPKSVEVASKRNDKDLLNALNTKLENEKDKYNIMTDKLTVSKEDVDFDNFFENYKKMKKNIKKDGKVLHLTPEEGLIISRYRYMHGISQLKICAKLDIVVETLKRFEEKNKEIDPTLYLKIRKLDSHLSDFYASTRRR